MKNELHSRFGSTDSGAWSRTMQDTGLSCRSKGFGDVGQVPGCDEADKRFRPSRQVSVDGAATFENESETDSASLGAADYGVDKNVRFIVETTAELREEILPADKWKLAHFRGTRS
jgi:hypothetical protein